MPALRATDALATERWITFTRVSILAYSSHTSEDPSVDKLSTRIISIFSKD